MSLSSTYREIKQLRSSGDCAAALAMLRAHPPASDDDGFEAVVCLFVCGDLQSALNVCTTRTWHKRWARDITSALVERLARSNTDRALALAAAAASAVDAPADAAAIYLLLLKEAGK